MSIGVAIRAAVRSAPRVDDWPHGTRTGDGWMMVDEEAGAAIMHFSAPRQASVREIQIRETKFYFFVDDDVASLRAAAACSPLEQLQHDEQTKYITCY
jgi:hypothetical protein